MSEKVTQTGRFWARSAWRNRPVPVVSLAFLLLGCPRTQPPEPVQTPSHQTLTVATFPDYFGSRTLSSFTQKTGNRVDVEVFESNEQMLANLDGRRFDVAFLSGYAVEHLIERGRIAVMPRERVPNLAQVLPDFRNPPQDPGLLHCIPYTWWVVGLAYLPPKTGHVKEPTGLDELFSETGPQAVWLNDMRATLGMALRRLGKSANTRNAADVEQAKMLLLSAAGRGVELVDDPLPLWQAGRLSVSLSWSNDVFVLARKAPQVRFLLPKEGTLLYVDFACVLQHAKEPEVAFAFLDHLLDPSVSADIANTQLLPTVSESAKKLEDTEVRWIWGILDSLRSRPKSYEPLRDVGDATQLYEAAWSEVKAGIQKEAARRAATPPPEKKIAPVKKPKK